MSSTELTEAADFLEANGWLPTAMGTPAVEAVAAPLLPGDKGRIVAALREAARQADPMSAPVPAKTNRPHSNCDREDCQNEVGAFCWTVYPEVQIWQGAVIEIMPLFCSESCATEATR